MTAVSERKWVGPGAVERLNILQNVKTIAIVGASDKLKRASYFVATYLLSSSTYDVYFVNPILAEKGGEILGHPVYASLEDIPVQIDMVDVFRRAEDTPEIAKEAAAIGAKYFWLQLGIWSDEAAKVAEDLGMTVVMDRCVKIEHARFHGGLNLAGFNTGQISSKRQRLDA
ncbi:CoA-binding protein [Yaniella halotolerans]|uniref:CoA-binding protein n=1 Tax=Yaniella halotolerans TaxID=225453 RepID=UPI0003B5A56B|nr:CoA-binding protein [Yaniella halotolerans]